MRAELQTETCRLCGGAGSTPTPEGLRTLRETAGLTQAEMAKLAGCGQGYISEVERGKRNAGRRLIAAYLKIEGKS